MISLNLLPSKYLSTNIQIIVSAKSLLLLLTFWLYSPGIPQELPREKYLFMGKLGNFKILTKKIFTPVQNFKVA